MKVYSTQRRVVITGLGAIAPNGIGKESFWHATQRGISGISCAPAAGTVDSAVPALPAGYVTNFSGEQYIERKLLKRTDRMTQLAFAALQEALADAHLTEDVLDPQRTGLVIANTMGGVGYVLKQLQALYTRGPRAISAYTAIAWLNVATVGQAAIQYGIQGYCKTPVNDSASGLEALGMAYRALRRGSADIILAGGCEAFLYPLVLRVMASQGICVQGSDPNAYRPFDRRAGGLLMAEGAGICILEDYEHAHKRGATIYGEIVGFAQTNDAHGLQMPSADGTYYARAICQTIEQANIQTEEIAYFSLDGRAVPSSDLGEAQALRLAFGTDLAQIPVSVPRTSIGHSYAAAGALDTITALQALAAGLIPPTTNCEELDPRYPLQMVRETAQALPASTHARQVVLLGARSIGGSNLVLALQKGETA
ncbi:beta-ketoacyl-[acyl-carrier-protein] synthase family protein [Ktedonosporobacter rubrisoli]|uniref:Beta-ketoacyl-[acyl-carrier-protein] synthase family protein n=1 Tax=Ktedonosporobacter rubrisoli TaxID=2509675 RepID=A0A4P6K1K9_KTERU|nr:beta-ketoacyl-[acyl-carrier-protein] synthase family protein [Ktedonosporobacter rubrisoli]QBD81560.1 beta-ketoacyl-[acyl-carrier-protein] synthase family protein [Ktedonosporobacter rubrisoli]